MKNENYKWYYKLWEILKYYHNLVNSQLLYRVYKE